MKRMFDKKELSIDLSKPCAKGNPFSTGNFDINKTLEPNTLYLIAFGNLENNAFSGFTLSYFNVDVGQFAIPCVDRDDNGVLVTGNLFESDYEFLTGGDNLIPTHYLLIYKIA